MERVLKKASKLQEAGGIDWHTTAFLGGRCRKAMLGAWNASCALIEENWFETRKALTLGCDVAIAPR